MIRIRPDDDLIFQVRDPVPHYEIERMRAHIADYFAGHRALIIQGNVDIVPISRAYLRRRIYRPSMIAHGGRA